MGDATTRFFDAMAASYDEPEPARWRLSPGGEMAGLWGSSERTDSFGVGKAQHFAIGL